MQPEIILQSDVLDIIFENRNKSYGAYSLRKNYDRRIMSSVGLVIGLVLVWFLFSFFKTPGKRTGLSLLKPVNDSARLVQIEPVQPPPAPPLPPPPILPNTAMVRNASIVVVRDNLADSMPPPTMDEIDKAKIGLETRAGDPDSDIQPTVSNAQKGNITEPPKQAEEPLDYLDAEVMPRFPGGPEALVRFLKQNIRMPEEAMEAGSRVVVKTRFVVQKEGSIGEIEIIQPGGRAFDEEVVRVINKMPNWSPGSQNGRNVAVYFTLPIVFEATEE